MSKRILVVVFLSLQFLAANAFIDGIIDDVKDQVERRLTPFFIRLKDASIEDKATVSNSPKQLRLKLFYKKDLVKKIRNIEPDLLAEVVNDALDLESQLGIDSYGQDLYLNFTLENAKVKSSDPSYFEAHFISEELVLNEVQAITASFDVDDFMEAFNIDRDRKDRTEEHTLKIRPITYETKKGFTYTDLTKGENDFVSKQIKFEVPKDHTIMQIDSIEFEAYRNGRLKKSFLKQAKRKFVLTASTEADIGSIYSSSNGSSYSFEIPIDLNLENPLKLDFIQETKQYKALIPVLVNLTTDDGLPMRIKVFSKTKVYR